MENQRFSLLLLEPGEIYFEDFSVDVINENLSPCKNEHRMNGRLKMCSKSLVFEAKNNLQYPLIKIMYRDCTNISRYPKDASNISDCSELCLECHQFIEMLNENLIQPYRFIQKKTIFIVNFHYAKLDECLQQISQLFRAATLSSHEQNSMIATITYSRHSRIKFNPLWLNNLYERTIADFQIEEINPLVVNPGRLLLTNSFIYYQLYNNIHTIPVVKVPIKSIVGISKHRYLLRHIGLKIRWKDSNQPNCAERCWYFAFQDQTERNDCYRSISEQNDYSVVEQSPESTTLKWQNGIISNYDYLLYLNSLADRSFQDLTQYPVFPWIITDYWSAELNLKHSNVYRDLSKPVGALNPERLTRLKQRYEEMSEPKFLYGSHYSTPGFVLYYLVRKHPDLMLCLQNGKFDHPDRMFNCVGDAFNNCMNNMSDFKELIPEFYDVSKQGDFLLNTMKIDFGLRSDGTPVQNVTLPPWALNSPTRFVQVLREALESDIVSSQLHHWIDLIFGYKQQGTAAFEADNIFYHLCYEGSVDLSLINDLVARHAVEVQISEFGQIPKQIFRTAHVSKLIKVPLCLGSERKIELKKEIEYFSHKAIITALAVDAITGNIFTTSKDGTMTCYNTHEKRKMRSVQVSDLPLSSVQLSSDGSIILGGWDNTIIIYNMDFGKISCTIPAHDDAVSCLSYICRHNLLISASWDCSIKIWRDYHNDSVIGYLVAEEKIISIDTYNDERYIRVAVGLSNGELLLYEIDSKNVQMSAISTKDNHKILVTYGHAVRDVKFSGKGTLIASCSDDKQMCVIDSQSFMKICGREFESSVRCLNWIKNDQYLLIGDHAGTVHVWNMVQGLIQYRASLHSDTVYCIAPWNNVEIVSCGKDDNKYCIKIWKFSEL
uniref:Putative neutral sphingomyelinase n=2 Tax=Anopheles darlingi TaxID=43151 RepID=A0A2M4CUC0_ANODA